MPIITIKSIRNLLLLACGILLLSGCSRDAVTDVRNLKIATASCFQASFSLAKSRYPEDLDKINKDFSNEIYRCMVWKVAGSESGAAKEQELTDMFKEKCPFTGLQFIVRDEMVACLTKEATPLVLANGKDSESGNQ